MPKVRVMACDSDGKALGEVAFEARVAHGKVLFEELDAAGHQLPHGCLAGSCGSCRVNILQGGELLAPPSVIEADTIKSVCANYRERNGGDGPSEAKVRMACRTKVASDADVGGVVVLVPLK